MDNDKNEWISCVWIMIRMNGYLVSKYYFVITIKYGEPEKTTGPSGVVPSM